MKSEHITEVEQTIPPSRLKRFLELAGSFYGIALLISAIAAVLFAWLANTEITLKYALSGLGPL